MKTFPVLLCAAFFSVSYCNSVGQAAESPVLENNKARAALSAMQGKPAPALRVGPWINTPPLALPALKGKIVVLDFWATWCGPCLASVPHMNELQARYADQGVVFIGVCALRGAEKMAATVKKYEIKYPVAADNTGATVTNYKVDGYPDYYIIDRKGNLRWADLANKELEKAIDLLLAEK